MKRIYLFTLLACMLFSSSSYAQSGDTVYNKLVKRYGYAMRWGNVYIVKANAVYAFANNTGKLITQFRYTSVDTVLNNRAIASYTDNNNNRTIINGEGNELTTGSARDYHLVNKQKRIFAFHFDNYDELLCNDSGRQLTFQGYNPESHEESLVRAMLFDGKAYTYGLITRTGDTVLPLRYTSVSFGNKLYAGMRNDTAYVYELGKGLLFSLGGIHDCNILHNDFIVVKKYGMSALVNRVGKLLTGFTYLGMEDFRYPYNLVPADATGNKKLPPLIPQYALINDGQPKGLIDADGHEVLPAVYDNIAMNTNGWFALRKALHDEEELTDPKFKIMLEGDAFGINFLSNRYVSISKEDINSDDEKITYYDMQLRKYVAKVPDELMPKKDEENTTFQHRAAGQKAIPKKENAENTENTNPGNNRDTITLNRAHTQLLCVGGKWGVRSVTGDTILAFIYDSVGQYNYQQYFIGKDGLFAVVDGEGNLGTPMGLPSLPLYTTADSIVFMQNKTVYSYKGWRLRKINPDKEPVKEWTMQFNNGIAFMEQGYNGIMKPGIYNRKLQYLGAKPQSEFYASGPRKTGITTITNTTGDCLAVTDSNGKKLTAWIDKPRRFKLYDYCALAINDTGKADLLYQFDGETTRTDTVYIDSMQKRIMLYGNTNNRYNEYAAAATELVFTCLGTGKGYVSTQTGKAFIKRGTTEIRTENYLTFVKTNNKWGLYDYNCNELIPPEYDSIKTAQDNCLFLYNNGKMGAFTLRTRHIIPPVYDTIGYTGSLANNFLVVYKGKEALFIDGDGKVLSRGWTDIPLLCYSTIGGIPATKNGIRYHLFPSLGDTLLAINKVNLPEGVTSVEYFMDGTCIVAKGGKKGVYDVAHKKWLVPARYTSVEEKDEHFVAITEKPYPTTSIYRTDGRQLFTIKGRFYPQRIYGFDQWYMLDWYGVPVVNDAGKTIVPDTFKNAFTIELQGRALYQTITQKDKRAIIDTSGRVMVPAILDYVSTDSWMYNGYFIASQGGRECLISPQGKMLTPCIYDEIFGGLTREIYQDNISSIFANMDEMAHPALQGDSHPYFIVTGKEDGNFGVIDSNGKVLVPCSYDSIRQVHNGRIAVAEKGKKWGLVSLRNKPLTTFKYDSIGIFYDGQATFKRAEIKGILSENGEETPLADK